MLQVGVVGGVEVVSLEDRVQFAVLALVEGDGGAGADDRLAAGEQFGGTERPEKRDEAIDVPDLQHRVTQTRGLLAVEPDRRRRRRLLMLMLIKMMCRSRQQRRLMGQFTGRERTAAHLSCQQK